MFLRNMVDILRIRRKTQNKQSIPKYPRCQYPVLVVIPLLSVLPLPILTCLSFHFSALFLPYQLVVLSFIPTLNLIVNLCVDSSSLIVPYMLHLYNLLVFHFLIFLEELRTVFYHIAVLKPIVVYVLDLSLYTFLMLVDYSSIL